MITEINTENIAKHLKFDTQLYWFWDDETGGKILTLGYLKGIHMEYHPIDGEIVSYFVCHNSGVYRYCQPFKGEISERIENLIKRYK